MLRQPFDRRLVPIRLVAWALLGPLGLGCAFRPDDGAKTKLGREAQIATSAITQGRPKDVHEPLARWLKAAPDSAEAHFQAARLAFREERSDDCIAELEKARSLGLDPASEDVFRAVLVAHSDRFAEAEVILKRALSEPPDPARGVLPEVPAALAKICLATYRLSEAVRYLELWKAQAPFDPRPYLWRADIDSRRQAEPTVLIDLYRKALTLDPDLAEARLRLAETYLNLHRNAESDQEFRAYTRLRPEDPTGWTGAGRNAAEMGDVPAARQAFERALALTPNHTDASLEIATLDLREGDPEKARVRLERLIRSDPYDYAVRLRLAQVLEALERRDEAREARAVAERLRAENQRLDEIQAIVVREPMNLEARTEATRWLFEHGRTEAAVLWAERTLRVRPDHRPTHRLLAQHFAGAGNPGRANYHRLQAGD